MASPQTPRTAVIELHKAGTKSSDIMQLLNLPRSTVYKAISRFKELGTTVDRLRSGRPRTALTSRNTKLVKNTIQRNPKRSMRKMAKNLWISDASVRRIVKNDLGLRSYKQQKIHELTDQNKTTRFERCKKLMRRFGGGQHSTVLFTDEKISTVQPVVNKQNDRIISTAHLSQIRPDLCLEPA